MSGNSESEVEVDPYEKIVGLNLNYSTRMASRASSPLPRDKNEISKTHFNGPIVKCTGFVASVDHVARSEISMLSSRQNSSATVAQHLDGNRLRTRHALVVCLSLSCIASKKNLNMSSEFSPLVTAFYHTSHINICFSQGMLSYSWSMHCH